MNFTDTLEDINIIIDILKLLCICFGTSYTIFKNTKIKNEKIKVIISIIFISVICGVIKYISNFMNCIICLILLLSLMFSKITKMGIGNSTIITTISLSINYILFLVAVAISYFPNRFMNIKNNYIGLLSIVLIYSILIYMFFKKRKFKDGFSFLKEREKNDYFDVIVLNVSVIIMFMVIILQNYNQIASRSLWIGFAFFSIIMFITIQKSLQLYYKQKLLIQDLEETKKELEKKNKEVEELEKENLNFSKISHSIAHKQKSLEYKLNQLMMENETSSEIDIKNRLDSISKEYFKGTTVELDKTEIPQIDDMLKYMQSECIKNKIDFQLQLNGNIYHMINKYITKEELEILIADHIKNAIIAIESSDNINKSILVRLGEIDGVYGLYIYDSGIEFEIDTLLDLGTKPHTTHADNGGTGMGFMNTFDTLKKHKASIIISEYNKPCKESYTKLIAIRFDNNNEFKICSYRKEEIRKQNKTGEIKIEKLEK